MKEIGLGNVDVALKSDQEKSMMDVLNNVAKRRSADSRLELLEGRGIPSVGSKLEPYRRHLPWAAQVRME